MLNSNRRWPTLRGCPAFGCALTGSVEYRTRLSTTASIRCGPMVQLVPSMTIGSPPSPVATPCGVSPPRVRPADADGGPVDLLDLVGVAVAGEPEPVRPEGVGLDDVGARGDVALVDGGDQLGVGQVDLGQRPVECASRGVQHRAHGAVADDQ